MALLVPSAASAAFGQIIPEGCYCEDRAPDWGCALQVIQNLINIGIVFGVLIATLVITYAGALWILNPFRAENRKLGRTLLMNAVIGLIIAAGAWLFVDFLMKTLYNPSTTGEGLQGAQFGPWNEILSRDNPRLCIEPRKTGVTSDSDSDTIDDQNDSQGDGDQDNETDGETTTVTQGCPNCVVVSGVARKGKGTSCGTPLGCNVNGGCDNEGPPQLDPPADDCKLNSSLLNNLKTAVGNNRGWQISEMWPPTREHAAECHSDGSCADVAKVGGTPTVPQIIDMAQRLVNQGLHIVVEGPFTSTECQQIMSGVSNHGGRLEVLKLRGAIHFSTYLSDNQQGEGCINF